MGYKKIGGLRDVMLPVSEYFLAFDSFSPRITDLPTCLCDAPVCVRIRTGRRRQVACTDPPDAWLPEPARHLPAIATHAGVWGVCSDRRWQAGRELRPALQPSGVRRTGEAGGHLFVIFSACKPNNILHIMN